MTTNQATPELLADAVSKRRAVIESLQLDTPNFDACDDAELSEWLSVFQALASMVSCQQLARFERSRGNIEQAKWFESRHEAMYRALPAGVRW